MAKNKDKTPAAPEEDMAAELLLKESEDALNQENMQRLWNEWGSTIIGCALMVIFGTMIGVGWQNWRASVQSTQTSALIQSQQTANDDDLSGSYKGISNLMQAGRIEKSDVTIPIIYKLMEEAADSGLPTEWDILAEWAQYRVAADANPDNQIKAAEDLEKLSGKNGNPYAPAIMMESAILYGENGQNDKAISLLNQAQSNELTKYSPDLQTQLSSFLSLYQMDK